MVKIILYYRQNYYLSSSILYSIIVKIILLTILTNYTYSELYLLAGENYFFF